METISTKLTDFPTYTENPSGIIEEDIKVNNYIEKGGVRTLTNDKGVEVLVQELGTQRTYKVDSREYRKIYVDQLSNIKELSNPALKVLCYILKELKPKKDEVTIFMDDAMSFTGYESKVNIYKGIIELLNKKLIYRKIGNGVYFIDINSFYNGSRI